MFEVTTHQAKVSKECSNEVSNASSPTSTINNNTLPETMQIAVARITSTVTALPDGETCIGKYEL